MNLIA